MTFPLMASGHEPGGQPEESPRLGNSAGVVLVPFGDVESFTLNGNTSQGLATKKHGAQRHEIWRSTIAPGGRTPFHSHSSEETFVFLKGEGKVIFSKGPGQVETNEIIFKAPCTVIAPAGVPHQVVNTGKEPTVQIVVVSIDSAITSIETGKPMKLPWRL